MIKNTKQKQISARDMVRHYKEIISQVSSTHEPTIITTGEEQVALISIDDLRLLQSLKYRYSAKSLIEFAHKAQDILRDANLPSDLSINHDKYFLEDE